MRSYLRFPYVLAGILVAGFGTRLAYVLRQAEHDPSFTLPLLDGAYYLEWARALATGAAGPLGGHPGAPAGAFYLAPLYPWCLSLFLRVFGDNPWLLHYVQELLTLAAAAAAALAGRRLAGEAAGLAAAVLVLTYHPLLFFAAHPLGEALAIALLGTAVALHTVSSATGAGAAGVALGLACLGRPNLLLVAGAWVLVSVVQRRARHAAALATGVALAVLPVAVRNFVASGHAVAISSNGGVTLYQGNAEGAEGIGTFAPGLSGRLSQQQEEARRIAELYSERDLDAVEADHWWRARALSTRLEHPADTAALLARKAALTLSNTELALDYAPALDRNPWRRIAPVPLAAILGLAAVGLCLAGWRGTGGAATWAAIAACAATPLVFYVSSRYRLPLAFLLCLPAGAGAAALFGAHALRRRLAALVAGAAVFALSVAAPTAGLDAVSEAAALANRARAWQARGEDDRAREDLERALELDPDSIPALQCLAQIVPPARRETDYDPYYRRALEVHPATPVERWTAEVLAQVAGGELGLAWRAADQAQQEGVTLDPALLGKLDRAIERFRAAREGGNRS